MLRVLVFDQQLGTRVYAYGPDRRELRFRSVEEIAAVVHPQVGHGKNWPCVYLSEDAPPGQPALVPMPDVQPAPTVRRTFARPTPRARTFRRLSR